MTSSVRVRYAPSPTGFPHVGNIRTALFNWLFARHNGGRFLVRIEDTDVARTVPGAVEAILDGLRWLGLDWDEGPEAGGDFGPYYQSQRLPMYRAAAEKLVAQGDAYYCYCSPRRLEEMRAEQTRRKQPPGYDRRCRCLSDEAAKELKATGITPVVRFKTPLSGEVKCQDFIRGEVVFDLSTLDDFVLLKSDGYPTYHLANIVDDHAMQISHVLRAEEWLSSTPRHLLLYRAMQYEPPQFAHLPMILGTDRSKLSKRHGAVSITEYMEKGYLPEAMFNFLALLGWSLDDRTEILSRDEFVRHFSLERVSRTAAIFNIEKLDWMNGYYIRSLAIEDLAKRSLPFLEKLLPPVVARPLNVDYVKLITPLVQERARTLVEIAGLAEFFFVEPEYEASLLVAKGTDPTLSRRGLAACRERIENLGPFDAAALEAVIRPLAEELGVKPAQLFSTLRVATTGRTAAPPLFQTMAVLGRERCLRRMDKALAKLSALTGQPAGG